MFNLIDYIKEFFGKYSRKQSCDFDYGKGMTKVIDKQLDRKGRAYANLSKQYDNFDDLPLTLRNRLLYKEFRKILEEDEREDLNKKSSLRKIKTLRTRKEIKDAQKAGYRVLKQKVKPSKEIRVTDIYIKDLTTGEVYTTIDDWESSKKNKKEIKRKTYYPYKFPSKVAAYLLPDDLQVGERVILEDLIEDIVGESHAWGTYRLDSAEAIWNGKKFVVDCNSYEVSISIG